MGVSIFKLERNTKNTPSTNKRKYLNDFTFIIEFAI